MVVDRGVTDLGGDGLPGVVVDVGDDDLRARAAISRTSAAPWPPAEPLTITTVPCNRSVIDSCPSGQVGNGIL